MLFNSPIFGPIKSRRLGTSLGVNLLPHDSKLCSFNCIYCECGYNFSKKGSKMPKYQQVITELRDRLTDFRDKNQKVDTITFAGNGEPTMHPDFNRIIRAVVELRNELMPTAKISVLSNSLHVGNPDVFEALKLVDNNILKIDSAVESTIRLINQPSADFSLKNLIDNLKKFEGNLIIQTLFFSGKKGDKFVDNTTDYEVSEWIKVIEILKPQSVMIYTLDRPAPEKELNKLDNNRLKYITDIVESKGIKVFVNE